MFPEISPAPVSSPAPYPGGVGVLHLPELLFPLFSPSTKQLELWFSSLQEDAGQRCKWERMGLLGCEGRRSVLLVPTNARMILIHSLILLLFCLKLLEGVL